MAGLMRGRYFFSLPTIIASGGAALVDGGMSLGFFGTGLLAWFVSAPTESDG